MRRKWQETYDLPEVVAIRKKILDTFNNKLEFIESTHQYFLNEVELISVTTVTHRWEDFNREEILENCYQKGLTNPDYKYFGMSKQEISDLWDRISGDACEFGTEAHEFGESYFYYMIGEDDKILPSCKSKIIDGVLTPTNGHEESIVKFWNDLPDSFIPVLAETKVFSEKYKYAGTFDILFYYKHPTDESKSGLCIFDYKSNKDLYKNFNEQKLLHPFNDLLSMPLSLYKLQLSLYQIPLEDIGLKVIARRVIWLKNDGYEKVNLEQYTNILREIL